MKKIYIPNSALKSSDLINQRRKGAKTMPTPPKKMDSLETYVPQNPLAFKKGKKSKYRNKKVEAMGKRFDSIGERDRYFFLMEAQRRGEIRNLRCQVRFDIGTHYQDGSDNPNAMKWDHFCYYVADFVYEKYISRIRISAGLFSGVRSNSEDSAWIEVIEDFKGGYKKLPLFALKEKLMNRLLGLTIRIVKSPTLPI